MKITQYFIDRHRFSNLLVLFIVIAGILTLLNIPKQNLPNINFDKLEITTVYPGASPEDVEINVTDPIEDELDNVDGLDEINSFSVEGMSYIVVTVDPDVDNVETVKDEIRRAVDRVKDLPKVIEDRPFVQEIRSTDFPIIEYAVGGEGIDEGTLRKIVKDLESDFKAISDVGSVDKVGYRKKEIQVLCDLGKMEEKYVSFTEILQAINQRNIKVSGGTLESFVDEKKIVTFAEFEDPMEVGDVIVRSNFSGEHLKIKDVALVKDSFKKKNMVMKTNGIDTINLIVKRKGSADTLRLRAKIEKIVEQYKERFAHKNIKIFRLFDDARYTRSLLSIVARNAAIGFCLVVLTLFVFLNFSTAIWVALGIPLSILGAYIFFPIFGITTNRITLIALIVVLGMLVDDAIVVAENISRHREAGLSFRESAIVGTREVFLPVLATIATTMICFSSIFFMKGILGRFIMTIPIVIILTLGFSLFESITILPCHLTRLGFGKHKKNSWIETLRSKYSQFLMVCLKYKGWVVAGFVGLLIFSVMFFGKHSKFVLFSSQDDDFFYIVMETPLGYSLGETAKLTPQVEQQIQKIPKDLMLNFKTTIGTHSTDEAASDPSTHENWALSTVYLRPASERDTTSEEIIEKLREWLKDVQGFTRLEVREITKGPPVGKPITINLVSDDFGLCLKYEQQVLSFLKNIKGVYDLESSNEAGKQEIRLKLNYDLLAKVGITARDISEVIRMAYDGVIATTIRRAGEEIDYRIKLGDDQRGDIDVLKELLVPNTAKKLIKLKHIAEFEVSQSRQTITHYQTKKSITVSGRVHEKIVTSKFVNKQVNQKFSKEIKSIPGLDLVFGGEEKETMRSMHNFFIAFLCSLLGIYFILVLLLDSFLQPFLIMLAIPFGVIGVLFAFHVHGLHMSFLGIIGTLGMIGVVVNDSLIMVTYLNSLKQKHGKVDYDMILEGAKTRLRPVLLTTITTVVGLLPTVYGWGGYEPFIVPMVMAMAWGLVFATIITLVLIPVLYSFKVRKKVSLPDLLG